MTETISAAVGTAAIDNAVLDRLALRSIEYADRYELTPAPPGTPEEWARALFGDRPVLTERVVWAGLLRLHLDPVAGPDTVAGWAVAARGDGWIRLETCSRHLDARLLVQAGEGCAAVTTALHYRHRRGARTWAVLSPIHRMLVPLVFRTAAKRRAAAPPVVS